MVSTRRGGGSTPLPSSQPAEQQPKPKPTTSSSPTQLYLFAYNSLFAAGWAYTLAAGLRAAATASSSSPAPAASFFAATTPSARLLVLACILETIHALLGIVPSSPTTCFLQWWGRENALFQIALAVPSVSRHPCAAGMVLCWCCSELIRYPWYALTLTSRGSPRWLTWLRYSAFIPLYPLGVACELTAIYLALPDLRRFRLWSVSMPNAANFAFDYSVFITVMSLLYPYLFWGQYSSLLSTRRKKLGGSGVN
jgi:very-long-chain (3R)-3-hydroxyacyl-CoA dehydratase